MHIFPIFYIIRLILIKSIIFKVFTLLETLELQDSARRKGQFDRLAGVALELAFRGSRTAYLLVKSATRGLGLLPIPGATGAPKDSEAPGLGQTRNEVAG